MRKKLKYYLSMCVLCAFEEKVLGPLIKESPQCPWGIFCFSQKLAALLGTSTFFTAY